MLSHAYWYADEGEARQIIYNIRNRIREEIDRNFRDFQSIARALHPAAPWL